MPPKDALRKAVDDALHDGVKKLFSFLVDSEDLASGVDHFQRGLVRHAAAHKAALDCVNDLP